ncbi:MAG: PKD domain-containing protein [Baekduia sp.]
MTSRRPFLAALLTAAACAAAAPVAGAAGWTEPHSFEAAGGVTGFPEVAGGPDGAVDVLRFEQRGNDLALVNDSRSSSGTWSATTEVAGPAASLNQEYVTEVDDHGNVTVAWSGSSELWTATKTKSSGVWSTPTPVEPGVGNDTGPSLAPLPGGRMVAVWTNDDAGSYTVRLSVRDADGTGWGPVTELAQSDATGLNSVAAAVNRNGSGVAFWIANVGGQKALRAARFGAEAGSWEQADDITTMTGNAFHQGVDIASDGSATAVWIGDDIATAAYLPAGSSDWSAADQIGTGPELLASVGALPGGRFVATYQRMTSMYSATAIRRSFEPGAGGWGPEVNMTPNLGGMPSVHTNAAGDAFVSMLGANDGAQLPGVGGALLAHGASAWDSGLAVDEFSFNYNYGLVRGDLDGLGNGLVTWVDGSGERVNVAALDGSAPSLSGVSVPASAVSGVPVTMHASASDVWSDISYDWDFGDGRSAGGASASHTFAAGTYDVTVTATDESGNSASRSATIVVSDPPAPPDDDSDDDAPPVVNPPLIEARLAGRTVTLNAKLSLKKGKRCSGTVRATTAFGGRSYKTTLRLATKNGACRATGTIKLKKTPSLRTKLRVTVSGSQTKSRTLTTRRG